MTTAKLAALQFYQLAIPAPVPPTGSYDSAAAARGEAIFKGKATCAQCHVPPLFTEPGWNRGLFTRMKGGFYHDGRFATLLDVVNHYNNFKRLKLSEQEKRDLVEFLKSL